MTGTGSIGNIATGWNVSKVSTPIIPGNKASGTGGASFSAQKKPDSLFVLNNDSTFSYDLDSVSGRINSVSDNGAAVSINQGSVFSSFDTEEVFPSLNAGNPISALALSRQILKQDIRLSDTASGGYLWTLAGHDAGFDKYGNIAEPREFTTPYTWETSGSTTTTENIITCVDSIASSGYKYFKGADTTSFGTYTPYANYVRGETLLTDDAQSYYGIAFKVNLNDGIARFNLAGGPDSSITNTDREIDIQLNKATKTLTLSVTYRSGGIVTTNTVTNVSTESLSLFNNELIFYIEYSFTSGPITPNYEIKIKVNNHIAGTQLNSLTHTFTADAIPVYYNQWELKGDAYYRSLWVQKDGPFNTAAVYNYETNYFGYYIDDSVFNYSGLNIENFPGGPVLGGTYNVWQYVQDSCSAFNIAIAEATNLFTFYKATQGFNLLDNLSYAASPAITPTSVLSAESVNVEYMNASLPPETPQLYSTDSPLVYSAYDDNNRIISVEPNQFVETSVKTNKYFKSIFQPVKSSIYVNEPGYYAICDSTGANVTDAAWAKYGGSISISINANDRSVLDIKAYGPSAAIPGKTAPYSFAYSSSENKYAAISITGSAVTVDKKSVELQTGVVESNKKQKTAATVTNRFINTLEQAYDRGVWVSQNVAGPNVSLSFALSMANSSSGKPTEGRFKYSDSIYRINSCTITSPSISYNTEWCVTLDDFDGEWSSKTVEFHDDLWGEYDIQDQIIAPFLGIEKVGVYLATDTDLNPDWVFEEFGEATMLIDTDGNPYIEVVGNQEDNTLLYLDSDFTPYYV
jgi:hypothetical protein